MNTDMGSAPKDRPILAYCVHQGDPYFCPEDTLTPYGCYCEALTHVVDGWHVIVWIEGEYGFNEYTGESFKWPDWWFRYGSDGEETAYPVGWLPIPEPPADEPQEATNEQSI